jgi:glutamyl-tRNA synthetase
MHRGRLAPSPTGAQHLGNARTFLLAWVSIRRRGGQIGLRIEDLDSPRVKPGAAEQLADELTWLGLDWDGPIAIQTQRLPLYAAALAKLQERELVYPCTCTRSDIEQAASAPHAEHEPPFYPGTCAGRRVADAAGLDRPFAWRFRSQARDWTYDDGFAGKTTVPRGLLGDFVVWKNNNTPAYQLAVVVDDADQGVTEVVRGNDLVSSTPRQLMLYEALGWTPPRFFHVPLVVGPDGRRLAKRHGDVRLASLRAAGVSPDWVRGFLAWSCGWLSEPEPLSMSAILALMDWRRIPLSQFILYPEQVEKLLATVKKC